ncbi:hypothetical protein [Cupriavidus sp. RAF12]|uniref:hypothetical protein n=1 Tax=Cupriavidus sp. RAF12 TaxID=3233050 RepID=UPI003F930BD5
MPCPASAAGVDPDIMGVGPIPATQKSLAQASRDVSKVGIVEINEALASQAISCIA